MADKSDAEESGADELHRRFKEALERKKSRQPGGETHEGGSKVSSRTSNAKTQRTFRRKSGG
jgi:hypothetical protein